MSLHTEKDREQGTIQKSASAVAGLQGAAKTGKAVAGAAKGAAMGGPFGAALMGIATKRGIGLKVACILGFIFLLPVLFILMLPSVIFGGLNAEYETPILNDDTAIQENIQLGEQIIWMRLKTSHDEVIEEISNKIAALGENARGVIVDEFMDSISFDSTLLLSQYSACKDYAEISLKDLENTISRGDDHLFSYEVTSSTDSDGITTYVYTVTYAGNDYFASEIFQLDDEGRELAQNYAENMMLHIYGINGQNGGGGLAVSAEVLQYSDLIRQYASEYDISEYFDLICAVMMTESGGRGTAPMQSSECPFNTRYPNKPNAITDPAYSIECGVHNLAYSLQQAGCTSPQDMSKVSLALQDYNFGNGYASWALDHYGGYSEANAIEFSNKKKAELGWSGYGNPRYVSAVMRYYTYQGVGAEGWGSPFVGRNWRVVVSSEYGNRIHPVTGKPNLHTGIDIAFPKGTPINAVRSGVVESATRSSTSTYGWHIMINHGDGYKTLYAHCSELMVSAGDQVSQGQVIGLVGATGRVTGAHLHLNVYKNGQLQNPRNYIP